MHHGLPSSDLTFIISLDDPIDLLRAPGPQAPGSFDAFVGGLHLTPAKIAHAGYGAGLSVELSPLGARNLLGLPPAPLSSLVVDLRDIGVRGADGLVERLREANGWDDRFRIVDDQLADWLGDRSPPHADVAEAWNLLVATGGREPIARVAERVGWSRRVLSTRFQTEFGVTPKEAARVIRFERTCELVDSGLPLAQAAANGGFFDQSHMTAEWKAMTGLTPVEWQRDALRDRVVS